jgi:purine-binding chemotaxis protein CheW
MNAVTSAEATVLAGGSPGQTGTAGQYLTFTLEEGVFGVGIESVREIIQYGQMTLVPLMPPFVRGVINLRGAIVPVIDLQARLGRAPASVGERTSIVIFEAALDGERHEIGMMVDAVSEVIDIADVDIEAAPQFGGAIRREFIHGMAKVDGRFLILLALASALDIEDMATQCDRAKLALAS